MFYCSSHKEGRHATPDAYPSPWGEKNGTLPGEHPGTDRIRSGYMFNPYRGEERRERYTNLPDQYVVSMDILEFPQTIPHSDVPNKRSQGGAWNIGFADGSVRTHRSDHVIQRIIEEYNQRRGNPGVRWYSFEPIRDYLINLK